MTVERVPGADDGEHYELLFVGNPLPMWVFEISSGRFLAVNAEACSHYGYTEAEFLGMTISDIRLPEEEQRLAGVRSPPGAGHRKFGVWQHRRKDGGIIDVEITSDDIVFKGRQARLVLANDVTERVRTEAKLREQAALLDRATDAILVRGIDRRIRYWNNAAERMYGIPRERALGRLAEEIVAYDDPAVFNAADAQVREKGEWSGRLHQATAGGRTLIVEGHWTLLRDEKGNPAGVLKIHTDVTERVDLEQRLMQSQKLESIGQLTGGIAHDFNNLLTVIIGNSEALAEELAGDPRLGPIAAMIREAGERGAELTNRLLAFARRQALEPRIVQPNELIDNMHGLLRRSLGENIELEVAHAADLSAVSVDPAQFESALLNLCINARDAMPGGGRLMIETSNVVLDQAYAEQRPDVVPGAYVQVAVSDTGTGMTPEDAARAFDPFFTTKPRGKGTGLGLSMVYGFTKQSGGHVAIYSELGHGTVVKLYLQQVAGVAQALATPSEADAVSQRGECILLVEDDDLVRAHALHLLEGLGYKVVAARNGPEALECLGRGIDVDLLFTDVIMPGGMTGPELAQAARAERPGLRVLYTSGYTENAIVHHGRVDAGVNLLHKPYRRPVLAAKIRAALSEEHLGDGR